jgi:hypothetical protein
LWLHARLNMEKHAAPTVLRMHGEIVDVIMGFNVDLKARSQGVDADYSLRPRSLRANGGHVLLVAGSPATRTLVNSWKASHLNTMDPVVVTTSSALVLLLCVDRVGGRE